ncbi:sugar-binding transcriptional regulator [Nakamurella endophytica]|uniref:Transcriptional regulator n=1 Tax=Nakamurella endophytica TaxID=1748367 RepID=A0A917TAB1_9ACTN|nr:sugar-binding domain-containing protein [Nakamurella endophytica]GGM14921.1 transcriptional regulator [Nakamurella endophytica]
MPAERPVQHLTWALIARRFYLDQRTKVEIAKEFGMSRFQVARILQQCLSTGLVTIHIDAHPYLDVELSERLRAAYGLQQAVVIRPQTEDHDGLLHALGATAADLLGESVQSGDVIGVTWGRTLDAMAPALPHLPRCDVVQMTGVVGMAANSVELVKQIAAVSGGAAYPIYAPLVVSTAAAARSLRQQPMVAAAMDHWGAVTRAAVAVGSWSPAASQFKELLTPAEQRELVRTGVVAEIGSTMIDDRGAVVASAVGDRCISMTTEQIRAIPSVVAVAGGEAKRRAIRAVLRSGMLTGLVTDGAVARWVLQHQDD